MKMVVKEGYKNTEVGVIPEDWEVIRLALIGNFSKGKGIRKDQSDSGHLPCVRYGELYTRHNDYIKEFYSHISFEVAETSRRLKVGDILFAGSGETKTEIGKCVAFTRDIEAYAGGDIVILSPQNTNSLFLGFLLNDYSIQKQKSSKGQGDAVVHISALQLGDVQIPLPTLPEQTAIATVLSDTDNLIQALEKKIAKKELIKKGAMQELLEPKEGWERIKIDDAIDVYRGGSPRPIQDYITPLPFGVNWIKIGDTSSDGKYITHTKERIIPEGALYSRSVSKGDFLLSNSMSFGRPYILKIDGCIHDGWLVLQNYQATFDREFLYYTLISEDVLNQYLTKASGSGVLNLNKELVKTVELNRPKDVAEQTRIAQILSDMDTEIESLQDKLSKYKQLKQGLMQELLTGRIRLV